MACTCDDPETIELNLLRALEHVIRQQEVILKNLKTIREHPENANDPRCPDHGFPHV
jgi:hypothetical protein